MIDCRITENYLKERARMCESVECQTCPFENVGCAMAYIKLNTKKCIDVIQKWSNENPRKTYLSDLLEKYPNAKIDDVGEPTLCPSDIGFRDIPECGLQGSCALCWNQEV